MPKEWDIPSELQPDQADYSFDLDAALSAIVGLRATAPADAFTASALGTDREGSGVVIGDDGLLLTMGYLITEAETVWLTCADGRAVPGHALAFDGETGFGLVQPLGKLGLPKLEFGDSAALTLGEPVLFASAGGRQPRDRDQGRRPAGVRRLLGIPAGRGDLHRAGAPVLGRRRADRAGRPSCSAWAR